MSGVLRNLPVSHAFEQSSHFGLFGCFELKSRGCFWLIYFLLLCLSPRQVQPEYSDSIVLQTQGQHSALLYRSLRWKGNLLCLSGFWHTLCSVVYVHSVSLANETGNMGLKTVYHLLLLYKFCRRHFAIFCCIIAFVCVLGCPWFLDDRQDAVDIFHY